MILKVGKKNITIKKDQQIMNLKYNKSLGQINICRKNG